MPIGSRNYTQYPEINYERFIRSSSTPLLDPWQEPIKGWESKVVNQRVPVNPRKTRKEEGGNPPTSLFKKLVISW
jgi:hypothetical protein